MDGQDKSTLLTWENSTDLHPLDIAAHSLKVETRVRILAGLPDKTEAHIVSQGG